MLHIVPLVFDPLLLDAVLVLIDERLVPDENEDPNDMIEFGRWHTLLVSCNVPDTEFRNLGAVRLEHCNNTIK